MEENLAEKIEIAMELYLADKGNSFDDMTHWDLNQERGELENEIALRLIEGEALDNKVLDYCFRNFVPGFEDAPFERIHYRTSTFDSVGAVLMFRNDVEKLRGERFMMTRGERVINRGVIHGSLIGKVENRSDLYLRDGESGRSFYVPPDVLRFLQVPVDWDSLTIFPGEISGKRIYLGGRVYDEFGVYLGNKACDFLKSKI